MTRIETQRIEPTRLEEISEPISDAIAGLSAESAKLGSALHSRTAANLADLVRIMNTYYSNLIEGHNTRPRDIERALEGKFDQDKDRRNLQVEAAAHVHLQSEIDRMAREGTLPEPASRDFILRLHRDFYKDAPPEMLLIGAGDRAFTMEPGKWRAAPEHEVEVGRHLPPSSARVEDFMKYFEQQYRFDKLKQGGRILAMAAAHHRFNHIHPFPDGNGRVSRLMSHAMAHSAGIGAQGLWSISRGLARGLAGGVEGRTEYKKMMDHADMPRQGALDGRGNLSLRALNEFVLWFLKICLDQVSFMSGLFDIGTLIERLRAYVARQELKPEASRLLEEALIRGEFERGDISRVTGQPDRSARRVLVEVIEAGLLASDTPKGPVSLRLPVDALEILFPRLF
ncbi:MAG TPA: Fic family protein [Xanthobacteraceae bacterium]|jgi:Fic family protein|nr:Fic family protein [Xanthobacteraceae bacterium]